MPDTAQIQFNVSVQDNTSQAAFESASKNVDQVRQVLRTNGIDPKTATIGFMSVQPVFDYKNPKQKVVGYRVSTDVTLKLKDFTKVGPITQQLADANVSETQTLTYASLWTKQKTTPSKMPTVARDIPLRRSLAPVVGLWESYPMPRLTPLKISIQYRVCSQ